jgi:predicted CoA-binding protein
MVKYGSNIAIIGASADRTRFSNKAVRAYLSKGYNVYPVNPKEKIVEGIKCYETVLNVPYPVDFVSVYLNPGVSIAVDLPGQLDSKNVKLAILNPGAANNELVRMLRAHNIEVKQACSILELGLDPSEF